MCVCVSFFISQVKQRAKYTNKVLVVAFTLHYIIGDVANVAVVVVNDVILPFLLLHLGIFAVYFNSTATYFVMRIIFLQFL